MLKAKVGFVVYGVHKDGLLDPSGDLFIDQKIIDGAKAELEKDLTLVEHDVIVATKQEAKDALLPLAKDDSIDALILFSGTWVWSAHMIAAIREFAKTGKGIVIWTHDGSQGWRPVGGLVLSAALDEVGIKHRFVYGGIDDPENVKRVVSYCRASALKHKMEMTTLMAFGGRGMGQTCGVADPSQWMKMFGIDIDSRDTHDLLEAAASFSADEVEAEMQAVETRIGTKIPRDDQSDRSVRLYMGLKKLKEEEGFDYYTIQSFPGLGDYYGASCFAQSMMLDDKVPTSTLSDFNTCMTSIIVNNLSEDPIYYGDLQHINKKTKEIKIIGDGAIPPSLADAHGVAFASHGIPTEGEAGGLSFSLVAKAGKGVLARVSRKDGKMYMTVVKVDITVPDDAELEARRQECGIPFWPHAFVTVHGDLDKMLESWNNEYACLGYGEHLYQEVIDFCDLTGMEVVCP